MRNLQRSLGLGIAFLLLLDGEFERPVMVPLTIVANEGVPPELVDPPSTEDNVRVVELMVVAYPAPDRSPEELDIWVISEPGDLCWLAA